MNAQDIVADVWLHDRSHQLVEEICHAAELAWEEWADESV